MSEEERPPTPYRDVGKEYLALFNEELRRINSILESIRQECSARCAKIEVLEVKVEHLGRQREALNDALKEQVDKWDAARMKLAILWAAAGAGGAMGLNAIAKVFGG